MMEAIQALPDQQRGVVRRDVLRIVAFFLLLAVAAQALHYVIGTGLRRLDSGSFGVWNRIVHGQVNAEILITGSSRALTHYDPRILQQALGRSAYNIGLNGSQTDFQLARLKTYLQHNRAPALLIHNLDAFSLQVTGKEVYDPGQYIPYLAEPDLLAAITRVHPEAWRWRYIPLYGYATEDLRFNWLQSIGGWWRRSGADTHIDGFTPRQLNWTGDFEKFRDKQPEGVTVEVQSEGMRQLEELLELAARHGSHVVLAYSPEYQPMQQMTRNRGEIFEHFSAIARKHRAVLLDFSNSPISARQDLFYNSQHLNAKGAAEFSHELANQLKDRSTDLFRRQP
jgi:hypothetical protein